ncbi:MAG: Strongly similar to phosphate transport system protein PhoU [uncultured bacterium]|nr:MAG: Strongly similar to phosphate transport system protein PhoU [uncultured bacterium]
MERHFDEELKVVEKQIIEMADLVQKAISKSVEALKNMDKSLAEQVIEFDKKIDEYELEIDERCIDLIARHQPMGSDLRFITTGIKINLELERIADLASNISQRVLQLEDKTALKGISDINLLSEFAQNMIHKAIRAYVEKDIKTASEIVRSDNQADDLKNRIQKFLINDYLAKDVNMALQAFCHILVARHLERMCDHVANIAEEVIYMVKGRVVRHHPEKLEK